MILTVGTTPAVARSMTFAGVTLDAVNRATAVRVKAAGKSVNVARVLHTLGEDVLCVSVVGGTSGQELLADLDKAGIAQSMWQVATATRVCVTVIDNAANQATELIEEPGGLLPTDVAGLIELIDRHSATADVIVCAGTLAPGVPMTFYADIARRAKGRIIIDAKGDALRLAIGQKSTGHGVIVKCNQGELLSMYDQADLRRAIENTLSAGAAGVIVTDGPRPTWVHDGRRCVTLSSPRVNVVSPIGSGDAVAAGVAAGLRRGASLIEAARLGIACGAANAQTAVAGEVNKNEVERLMHCIEVTDSR